VARIPAASTSEYERACCDHLTRKGLVARKSPPTSATRRSRNFRASTTSSPQASIAAKTDGSRSAHSDVPVTSDHGLSSA
jgi:hypothetical protein